MTDRLKEWLDEEADTEDIDYHGLKKSHAKMVTALRAVVELHKPVGSLLRNRHGYCLECSQMSPSYDWPCPTIRAIEKEVLK